MDFVNQEKYFYAKKCDLTFRCEDEYIDHIDLQHYRVCDECLTLLSAGPKFNIHIIQVYKFQCNMCGVRFIEESELKNHIREGHKSKCEDATQYWEMFSIWNVTKNSIMILS